jgi:PAS domain S-box-containing protein
MKAARSIVTYIYDLLAGSKNPRVYRVIFLLLFVSPVAVLALINHTNLDKEITESLLAKRKDLSVLSATIIDDRLDGLVNLGISYATRPRLIDRIEKGNWQSAIDIVRQALDYFPLFDRIVLYDPEGVIKADLPHALPSVIGQSRADREWYREIKNHWKPYISGGYVRGAEPRIPVIAVSVPITTRNSISMPGLSAGKNERKVIGILQFQVKMGLFSQWISHVDIGTGGIVYIVDQYGRIIYHPRYNQQDTMIDFSSVEIVKKLLKGSGGSEINYNPIEKEERLAAYEPVRDYGWGVVITQPTRFAFTDKNSQLRSAIITYCVIIFLAGALALIILYSIATRKRVEDALKKSELRYRTVADYTSDWEYWVMPDGHFRYISTSCKNISGYTAEEFTADPQLLTRIVHPEDIELYAAHIHGSTSDGIITPIDFRIRTKNGEWRWISHVCRPVYDSSGREHGRRASNRDITESKNAEKEREHLISELQKALSDIKKLSGLLPICASCKKIRDDKGYWNQIESYISEHSEAEFSHGICPECAKKLYPDFYKKQG